MFALTRLPIKQISSRNIENFSKIISSFHHKSYIPLSCNNERTWPHKTRDYLYTYQQMKYSSNIEKTKKSIKDFDKHIIPSVEVKRDTLHENLTDKLVDDDEAKKLGLFARFKLMYKKYWYVLIPVHIVTSIGWFGSFYYLSKSGVDIPTVLQSLHFSETIVDKLKSSELGHVAIAYLCYKLATPARYAVTLGGTTVSIKYLEKAGYIKPVPTKTQLIKMYEKGKKRIQDKFDEDDHKKR